MSTYKIIIEPLAFYSMIFFKNKNWKDNNTTDNDKDSGNVLVIKEQLFLNVMLNKNKAYVYNTFHC